MRGADTIPLALLAALAGAVGFRMVREPHVARAPIVVEPVSADVRAAARSAAPPVADTMPATRVVPGVFEPPFVPGPRSEEILRRMGAGAAGTYIHEMLEGETGVARWPQRPTEPIRIWVDGSPELADWNPDFARAARDGFDRWNAAGIPVRMVFVMDSTGAEVRVRWADGLPDKRVGTAVRTRNGDYWVVRTDVTLALHEPGGGPLTADAVRAIATHEAGHMLGLFHSPNPLDIMSASYRRQIEPSPADLNTMRLLYTLPPGRFR